MPFILRKGIGSFGADVRRRCGRLKIGGRHAQEEVGERVSSGKRVAIAVLTGELEHSVDFKIEYLVVLIGGERTAEFHGVPSAGPRKHVGVGEGVVREPRRTLIAKADRGLGKVEL